MTAAGATIGGMRVQTGRTPYAEAARELLRQTLFGAAREQLEDRPWSEVTMSDIAAAAGVSRQTLYKEFGNRNEFGLAFVINVGESFLDEVDQAVIANVDDPPTLTRPLPAGRRTLLASYLTTCGTSSGYRRRSGSPGR